MNQHRTKMNRSNFDAFSVAKRTFLLRHCFHGKVPQIKKPELFSHLGTRMFTPVYSSLFYLLVVVVVFLLFLVCFDVCKQKQVFCVLPNEMRWSIHSSVHNFNMFYLCASFTCCLLSLLSIVIVNVNVIVVFCRCQCCCTCCNLCFLNNVLCVYECAFLF